MEPRNPSRCATARLSPAQCRCRDSATNLNAGEASPMLEQRLLMNKIRVSIILSVLLSVASARAQQPSVPQPTQKELPNRQAEFFQKATNGSIFIYGPQVDPCAPLPEGRTLLPLGSGFVTGVEKRGASTPNSWSGWKFLVTAKHVLARQDEIIIRVNAAGES